jgi:hypothetical protein
MKFLVDLLYEMSDILHKLVAAINNDLLLSPSFSTKVPSDIFHVFLFVQSKEKEK